MKTKHLLIIPFLFLTFVHVAFAQDQMDNFYYYKGAKVFLEVNTEKVSISFRGKTSLKQFSNLSDSKTAIVEDKSKASVVSLNTRLKGVSLEKTYYMELNTNSYNEADYITSIESYKNLSNVLMVSPTYKVNGGKLGLSSSFYVKLKSKEDLKLLQLKASEMKLEILGYDKYMPLWFTLSIPSPRKLNALNYSNLFHESGLFENTEPAFIYHDIGLSADPFFESQWYLNNTGQNGGLPGLDIEVEEAWEITTGNSNIITAIYDDGFEMDHPDLQANTFGTGFDAVSGTSPARVRGRHGTPCAGIVGAVQGNNEGISGVAPGSKLMSISLNLETSDTPAQLASGFNFACDNGADVISNSWGGYAPSGYIDNAIKRAQTKGRNGLGCVIVFASGNDDNNNIQYPGRSNPDLLVVGSMSPCGERKSKASCDGETNWGSCFGNQLDVIAPGVFMSTTDRQGTNGYTKIDASLGAYHFGFNGTSSACPVVAGIAALVLSVNPDLTFKEVNNIIEKSAEEVRTDLYNYASTGGRPNGKWNEQMGYGLVNAYNAVRNAGGCIDKLTLTEDVPTNFTRISKANTSLSADHIINPEGTAIYSAGNGVFLKPGFIAIRGASFLGFIKDCSSVSSNTPGEDLSFRIDYNDNDEKLLTEQKQLAVMVNIYPNPTNGRFNIELTNVEQAALIEVYDVLGKQVFSQNNVSGNLSIDLKDQTKGIYFVRVTVGDKVFNEKVVYN